MPYQHVSFLRQSFFSVSVALYRIFPVLFPPDSMVDLFSRGSSEEVIQAFAPLLQKLDTLSDYATAESESTFLLIALSCSPY